MASSAFGGKGLAVVLLPFVASVAVAFDALADTPLASPPSQAVVSDGADTEQVRAVRLQAAAKPWKGDFRRLGKRSLTILVEAATRDQLFEVRAATVSARTHG